MTFDYYGQYTLYSLLGMFHGTYMKKLEDNSSLMVIWISGNHLYYSRAIHVSVISGTVWANFISRTQGCQLSQMVWESID